MSYITYTDDNWWKAEKLDDNEDRDDMGGKGEAEPMPPPNINVQAYDNRYGSFATRFGDSKSEPNFSAKETTKETTDDEKETAGDAAKQSNVPSLATTPILPSVPFTVAHLFAIAFVIVVILFGVKSYKTYKRKGVKESRRNPSR